MPSAARVAKNEGVFREVNERIRELAEGFEASGGAQLSAFVCECSRLNCTSAVQASLDEYRAVRRRPRQFLVLTDHVDPDHERIVRKSDRFAVVEKVGLAGEVAADEA